MTTPLLQEVLDQLIRNARLSSYSKGEVILRTDRTPPAVFMVKEGYVKVYSITEAGEENLHIIYGPDTIFPLIWAFTGRLRQVFYEAMGDVTLYRIGKDDFLLFLEGNPTAMKSILHRLIEMFNVYADRIDNLEYTKASTRVARRLFLLTQRFGKVLPNKQIYIEAPVRHHDLANSLNLSRETVSREMEKLEKNGLVTYKDHHIVILDLESLEREFQQPFL